MSKKKGCFAEKTANRTVTFSNDIKPVFSPYRNPMMWRFDLTNYAAVKDNAELIWQMISTGSMPPPPRQPFDQCFLNTYQQWMNDSCPE